MGSSLERERGGKGKRERGAQLWRCSLGSARGAARRARCGLPCSAVACSLLRAEHEEVNRKEEGERRRKRKGRKIKEKKKGENMENFPNLNFFEK
jgi:hypothetical protein